MHTRSRTSAVLIGIGALVVSALLPPAAMAAEGPPPPSVEKRVLSKVHTDAVTTVLTDGVLHLETRADLPEGDGTRLDPASVLFDVDDASRATLPAGLEFIGPEGSTVWIAPETNPAGGSQLWPGFKTDAVPSGALTGDITTFTLAGFEGPGDLELFTGGGFGGVNRLWSSDEGLSAFEVGRTHLHANWAFTAAGTYTLDVRADVATPAGPLTATATYTFVVGGIAPAVGTTTGLAAHPTEVVAGVPVTLTATVQPAHATGWVEMLDGTTSLGHAPVESGTATLEVASLPLGNRGITARFTPVLLNDYTPSTSTVVTVAVAEEAGGEVFGLSGLQPAYAAGDQIDLRVVGVTLGEGQSLRWRVRTSPGDGFVLQGAAGSHTGDRLVRDATTAIDGAQIQAELRGPKDGRTDTLASTAWYTLEVTGQNPGSGLPVSVVGLEPAYYDGDTVIVTAEHQEVLGHSYQWVVRAVPYSLEWTDEIWDWIAPTGSGPFIIPTQLLLEYEVALQLLDANGDVVGRSPAVTAEIGLRELQMSGAQSVYRVGDTLQVTTTLYPEREGVTYLWSLIGDDWITLEGETGPDLSLPITADLDGWVVDVVALDSTTGAQITWTSVDLRVSDAAPGEQLLMLGSLSHHYHQGGAVRLVAIADPAASDTDTYRWYWQRPDQGTASRIPGAAAATHEVRAQQALDGAVVWAELVSASGEVLATSATATISIDDHGAPPQEKATIEGLSDRYEVGDTVSLRATAAPASVLERWEWYVQRAGEDTPSRVADTTTADLSFPADVALDGAAIFARLTFDDGRAYVESPPVLLHVGASAGGEVPATELNLETNRAADDYWVGQTATFTAKQSTPTGLTTYRWLIQRPGETTFTEVQGQTGPTYAVKPTLALDGVKVRAELLDGARLHAASEPVTLTVRQAEVATVLEVTQDKPSYAAGDVAALVSTQVPQTDHDHYHWYIKRAGASDYVWVDQSRDKDLLLPVTVQDHGAQLVVRLFDDEHATLAESTPLTLAVAPASNEPDPGEPGEGEPGPGEPGPGEGEPDPGTAEPGPGTGEPGPGTGEPVDNPIPPVASGSKPGMAPASRTGADLDQVPAGGLGLVTTSVQQGQVLTIDLGAEHAGTWAAAWLFSTPTLLGGDWTQVDARGALTVRLPDDVAAGQHRLAVFAADGTLIGWASVEITAASGAVPTVSLASTGAEGGSAALAAVLLLLAGGGLVVAARRRRGVTAGTQA